MNVLAAVDFSGFTEPILGAVERIAAAARGARIWLLHVAEPDPSFVGYDAGPAVVRDQVAAEYRQEHRQLQACAERLRGSGVEVTPLLIQGAIADTILTEAGRLDVQLIVMGSHGHGTITELIAGGVCKVVAEKGALSGSRHSTGSRAGGVGTLSGRPSGLPDPPATSGTTRGLTAAGRG